MASHPVVHIEIPADNTRAASAFYKDAFGWQIQVDPNFDYHMFSAEGGPGGGFVKVGQPGAVPGGYKAGEVLVYLGSDDIEADLRNIEAHGGKVVTPKQEIPHVGWFAIFSDPAGNRLALFTPPQQ